MLSFGFIVVIILSQNIGRARPAAAESCLGGNTRLCGSTCGLVIKASVGLIIASASVFIKVGDPLLHLGTDDTVGVQHAVEVRDNQGLNAEFVRDFSVLDTLDCS